jgi:hypothetical protein
VGVCGHTEVIVNAYRDGWWCDLIHLRGLIGVSHTVLLSTQGVLHCPAPWVPMLSHTVLAPPLGQPGKCCLCWDLAVGHALAQVCPLKQLEWIPFKAVDGAMRGSYTLPVRCMPAWQGHRCRYRCKCRCMPGALTRCLSGAAGACLSS